MAYSALRTLVNRAGITFDALKTHVVFAEDMNQIKANIEYLESNRSALSTILNAANLGSGYLMRWDGSKLVNSKIYDNGTNVGIGTTTPGVRLQVKGGDQDSPTLGSATGGFALTGSNGLYGLYAGVGASFGNVWLQAQRNDGNTATYNLLLNPLDGNVGIGTTGPLAKLDVRGDTGARFSTTNFDNATLGGGLDIIPYTTYTDVYVQKNGNQAWGDLALQSLGGNVGIATTSPTAKLDILSDILRLRTAKTPASAGAAGNAGDMCWDSGYLYICVSTNTWKRSTLATW